MGRIFYLMGASGSGKDSLLCHVRRQIIDTDRCFVAHRYITREPELRGENHIWLTAAEFVQRRAAQAFAMQWQANGYDYGIGMEIELWLAQGFDVLVNGSRDYLPQAQARYPEHLVPLLVQVDAASLEQRLRLRGRETDAQILARIERAQQYTQLLEAGVVPIDNNGSLGQGANQLLSLIRSFESDSLVELNPIV